MNTLVAGNPLRADRLPYCHSRYQSLRRPAREVNIGGVIIGGSRPLAVQSMTTTNTEDVAATVRQTIELAEAGCDIVRITAPTTRAARALKEIRAQVSAAGFTVPLVADIHFAPKAALEAAEHVEKVRINPGNYADNKKFAVREYSDSEYERELERLHEEFSPIVLKCKSLGRAMRIGTNHGSLSDRIMNRFGDTPEGMVQSALEFIRIAESHGYRDIVLSMKASNPKVMIEAYRLAVARMLEEDMHYPLHLGVTEAGDGEDARVKSAIGIGALLYDGLGDTIRVSLTEDPIHEVPFGRELARRTDLLWSSQGGQSAQAAPRAFDSVDPFEFSRREVATIRLTAPQCDQSAADTAAEPFTGSGQPPRVLVPVRRSASAWETIARDVLAVQKRFQDAKIEGIILTVNEQTNPRDLTALATSLNGLIQLLVLEGPLTPQLGEALASSPLPIGWSAPVEPDGESIGSFISQVAAFNFLPILTLNPARISALSISAGFNQPAVVTLQAPKSDHGNHHPLGAYRYLAECLKEASVAPALWIRNQTTTALLPDDYFTSRLTESSLLAGALLCDGLGDWISVETEPDLARATALAYNILQGTRTRVTKTEYVACPSCGRTLFDLQSTTQKIRSRTDHLKGVTIAIMGCIVNGPGEMADADFGYVGGAPGKVNLYVGKTCVKTGIPEAEAVDRLIDLIHEHGKWFDPPLKAD